MLRRINKHHMVHTHHHHTRRHLSPNNMNATNYSIITDLTPNLESTDVIVPSVAAATSSKPTSNKKQIKIDWTVSGNFIRLFFLFCFRFLIEIFTN